MKKFFSHILTLGLFLFAFCVSGQERNFTFEQTVFDRDLVYDQVEDILIDSDGFTWIATATGLHKHNGYELTTFIKTTDQESSISENFITTLFEDSRGQIWIGTYNNGLNIYNKELGQFYNFRNEPGNANSITSNRIPRSDRIIAEDRYQMIWLNTGNGLNKIDPKTREVKQFKGVPAGQLIYDEREHKFWIISDKISLFDPVSSGLTDFTFEKEVRQVTSIVEMGSELWIASEQGLFVFDREKRTFSSEMDLWRKDPIKAIYKDKNDLIWIAIQKEIHLYHPVQKSFTTLSYEIGIEDGILDDEINGIYGNGNGVIVITYNSRGFTRINLNVNRFNSITQVTSVQNNSGESAVRSILQDKFENLWLGTYKFGVSRIMGDDLIVIDHDPDDPGSINSDFITALFIDSRDRLWVGTFEDGFNYSDDPYGSGKIRFESSVFNEKTEIHEFTEDQEGRIWISTNRGFYIYDYSKDSFHQYGDKEGEVAELTEINIQSVEIEKPGVFWMATWNKGLIRLELKENKKDSLTIIDDVQQPNGEILDNRFINIFKDSKGRYWLTSSVNGLIYFDQTKEYPVFQAYDKSAGSPSNNVYSIVEDKKGWLWISTQNGIGKFNPETGDFFNFYESDGLKSASFIWDSYYQTDEGEILYGSIDGITRFYPDSILETPAIKEAYLSSLTINHNTVNVGVEINDRVLLDKTLRFTQELLLTHKESIITFEFGALEVVNPDEIVFAYMLEGFDDDWIYTSSENRTATYTNLNRGNYQFKVKASKNMGQWGESSSLLTLTVVPPWWRTWWAMVLYLVVFMTLLFLFKRELVKMSDLRHNLELERYKHERDNELNQEKFRFFTTLSHELRTPLTLILGPLDRMIRKNETNNRVQRNLLLMQKQAQRLQKLTNQLMNFRKYEIENLKLKAVEDDVISFLEEIKVVFRQHAQMKEVKFRYEHEENELNTYFDRDKFEIIVVNLLSNAFKFTPKDGRVTLRVNRVLLDKIKQQISLERSSDIAQYGELDSRISEWVQVEVTDTGVGINEDQIAHVFERYFQASNIQNISVGGTGVGLEIAKNYTELHHGSIRVKSKFGGWYNFYSMASDW